VAEHLPSKYEALSSNPSKTKNKWVFKKKGKTLLKIAKHRARHWWLMPVILATQAGKDQEDRSSKPAQENSSQDPITKKSHHKKGLVEWLKVALNSSPSTTQKKKKKDSKTSYGSYGSFRK
jgi:hypothetical protein